VKLNNWGNKQDGNDKLVDITKDIKEASDKIKVKYEKINKENRELLKKINEPLLDASEHQVQVHQDN